MNKEYYSYGLLLARLTSGISKSRNCFSASPKVQYFNLYSIKRLLSTSLKKAFSFVSEETVESFCLPSPNRDSNILLNLVKRLLKPLDLFFIKDQLYKQI